MTAPDITFRPANEADLPAIIALLAADQLGATREDASVPLAKPYLDAFRAIDTDDNQLLTVAVDGNGFRPAVGSVDRIDAGIGQDQVNGHALAGPQQGDQDQRADSMGGSSHVSPLQ